MTAIELISGAEERLTHQRDAFGNWEARFSPRTADGTLQVPLIEAQAQDLPALAWPQSKTFALCLSHDVDHVVRYSARQRLRHAQRMWQNGQRAPRYFARAAATAAGKWAVHLRLGHSPDPYSQLERWLELEDKHNFRSTFFFFSDAGKRWHEVDEEYTLDDLIQFQGRRVAVGEAMRWMHQHGWEIGLHGSWFTSTDAELMTAQRQRIEAVIGAPVISNRQHYLHFDPLQTPQTLAQAGFKIDSTLGFNHAVGFRRGTCRPHALLNLQSGQDIGVTEVPLVAMDSSLFSSNRLNLTREAGCALTVRVLEQAQAYQGCVSINWHPHVADAMRFPGWFAAYQTIVQWAHDHNAWGCTLRDAVQWQQSHHGVPEGVR